MRFWGPCYEDLRVKDMRANPNFADRDPNFMALWRNLWVKGPWKKGAPWKSPKAGLSHYAWKSSDASFYFFHRPGYDVRFPNFNAGRK